LEQRHGKTGGQVRKLSTTARSLSLRESFLALGARVTKRSGKTERRGIERRLTAMGKQQWDGALHGAPLVNVMYAQLAKSLHLYGLGEHGESVKLPLVGTPVITVPPSFGEALDVCERSTVGPVGVIDFVWEPGVVQLSLEKGKVLL
jgi:hypothetical protein